MKVLDPVGVTSEPLPAVAPGEARELDGVFGKRVGILWGQHAATAKFRPAFVEVARDFYQPTELHVTTKYSTWNPATDAQMSDLASKIDFAVIGVGA